MITLLSFSYQDLKLIHILNVSCVVLPGHRPKAVLASDAGASVVPRVPERVGVRRGQLFMLAL